VCVCVCVCTRGAYRGGIYIYTPPHTEFSYYFINPPVLCRASSSSSQRRLIFKSVVASSSIRLHPCDSSMKRYGTNLERCKPPPPPSTSQINIADLGGGGGVSHIYYCLLNTSPACCDTNSSWEVTRLLDTWFTRCFMWVNCHRRGRGGRAGYGFTRLQLY
jgi:hypothetical protein